MRRALVSSLLVSAMVTMSLAAVQPASAVVDEFAGVWGDSSGQIITIEYVSEGVFEGNPVTYYSVLWKIPASSVPGASPERPPDEGGGPLCPGPPDADGFYMIWAETDATSDGAIGMDFLLDFCAGNPDGDGALPQKNLTPQPDGRLLFSAPYEPGVADVLFTRLTTQFFDVALGRFYTDAVTWLADEEITTGTSPTTFSPDDPVTRGQMATFLWRYDGEPDPASLDTPFADVPAGKFYSVAVAWLAEEAITTGTTPTTFSPDDPVTRGQMATFLWRYSGSPEPASLDTPFTDVPAGKFYSKAVAWLVEQGITTGTSPTTFSPDDQVTRGQMATFLWRLAGEPAV